MIFAKMQQKFIKSPFKNVPSLIDFSPTAYGMYDLLHRLTLFFSVKSLKFTIFLGLHVLFQLF